MQLLYPMKTGCAVEQYVLCCVGECTAVNRAVWRRGSSQHAAASRSESTTDDTHAAGAVCSGDATVNVDKPITCAAGE